MSEKLALTDRAGWEGKLYHETDFRQLYNEKSGVIWGDEKDKSVKKAIAQTAIGQKNVKVTPLEVANMMATIARGGEKRQVKIAEQIEYKNGTTLVTFKDQKAQRGDDRQIYVTAASKNTAAGGRISFRNGQKVSRSSVYCSREVGHSPDRQAFKREGNAL